MVIQQVVALVCNFSGSHDSSNVRLNHWEVETLFHEFGHALHSLLSRTVIYKYVNTEEPCHNLSSSYNNNNNNMSPCCFRVGLPAFFWYKGGS